MPFLAVRLKDAKGEHLITDKGKILERLKENFDYCLNRPSKINEETVNSLSQIDVNESMSVLPILDEINKVIASLSVGKTPGLGGIPPKIFISGGLALVEKLFGLFSAMWTQEY